MWGMESTRAIVVRMTRLGDSSWIVHWFGEASGLVKTVAKGARRPGSVFAGKLDLFYGGEIVIGRARRGELHGLREVVIGEWREGLRGAYSSTLLAAYCCQLLEMAVEPEHAEAGMYDLLRRALDHVDVAGASLRAMWHYERELARLLGVWHRELGAEVVLRQALGGLPANRQLLVEQLGNGGEG